MAPRKSKSISKRYSYASDDASRKRGDHTNKSGQRVSYGLVWRTILLMFTKKILSVIVILNSNGNLGFK